MRDLTSTYVPLQAALEIVRMKISSDQSVRRISVRRTVYEIVLYWAML